MAEWSKEVFSKNLKKYMESRGKNQKEIASIVGVSAPTVSEWLNNKKYPRIDKIEILANYFGILKSDLIEDKSEFEKKNDAIADIIIRMRKDDDFLSVVEVLNKLDEEKLSSVKTMLSAFIK